MDKHPTSVRRSLILLAALFCTVSYLGAQSPTQNIRGTVTDNSGNPLTGVRVQIKDTSQGTTTGLKGDYTLQCTSEDVLLFSFIGMKPQEIKVGSRTVINVVLQENVEHLGEIVVIGYGTQRREQMTGSVATVSNKELNKVPVSNATQLLVGKAPGITGVQSSGAPGADGTELYVRGFNTYRGSSQPLVLVDGVERPLNQVNPRDIETISVLKDAAAAAVYGMRAGNGVILITTKRGAEGKHSVSYNGSLSWSKPTTLPDFVDGLEYMKWYNKALELDGLPTKFTEEEMKMVVNGDPSDGYENTDWLAPALKPTLMQKHTIAVTGGSERIRYYTSAEFMEQKGFLDTHRFRQSGFRANIDSRPLDNLSFTLNVAGRYRNPYTKGVFAWGNQEAGNVWGVLMYARPFIPMEYKGYPTGPARLAINPYYGIGNSGSSQNQNYYFEGSSRLDWKVPFVQGLKLSLFGAWDYASLNAKSFNHSYQVMHYKFGDKTYQLSDAPNLAKDGSMYQRNTTNTSYTIRPSIEYSYLADEHEVGALLLYEQNGIYTSDFQAHRKGYDLFDIEELDFGKEIPKAGESNPGNRGISGHVANAGFVGRINYGYASKYLSEFSFRYDGTYLFAKGHRWGFFPSLSLAWVASQEDFMRPYTETVDRLKLRVSVGELGRNTVSPYIFLKTYETQKFNVAFGKNPTAQNTLVTSTNAGMPVPDLTWEKTRTYNVGLDLSLWHGLLGIEFDLFYKYTYDILQSVGGNYPPSLGGNYPTIENSGTFDNRGFELVLSHRNEIPTAGDLSYGVSGNVSFTRNRILKMAERENILPWQSNIGRSFGRILGLKTDGLFQTQEELDNAPIPPGRTPQIGDIKYVDINGDGRITYDDRVEIARSRFPELVYALNGNLSWLGIDFSFMLQGAARYSQLLQSAWNNGVEDMTPLTRPFYGGGDTPPRYLVENSWRPDNPNATYPRLTATGGGNNAFPSDFWLINGSYLRLRTITLGYSLPKVLLSRAKMTGLRIYLAGHNLLTFSGFKYIDPEAPNVLQAYYPQQKSLSVGLEVSF